MRRRGLRSAQLQITNRKLQIPQRGYILITLMLAMALVTIALLAVLPEIQQQIRRDREEEMRHRGTEYMRAIQHFYKKFNRYPTRIEELENTNNLRFLRKRYTDPMSVDPATGKEKDFKFLHQQDITLNQGPLLGSSPTGQQPGLGGGAGSGLLQQAGGFGQQGGFGSQGGFGQQGGLTGGGPQPGGPQPQGANGTQTPPAGDSGEASEEDKPNPGSPSGLNSLSSSSSGPNGQTFGGGPILGVASTNKKDKSIRVFNDKTHYNDWLFIYMPGQADRGGPTGTLLVGPVSLNGPTGGMNPMTPGSSLMTGGGMQPNGGQLQNSPIQSPQGPGQNSQQQ